MVSGSNFLCDVCLVSTDGKLEVVDREITPAEAASYAYRYHKSGGDRACLIMPTGLPESELFAVALSPETLRRQT